MNGSEKIKTVNFKLKKSKVHFSLTNCWDLALPSRNVGKYEFLIGEGVLPNKGLLEKAAIIKRFQYLPSESVWKNQIDIGEKQYQGSDVLWTTL